MQMKKNHLSTNKHIQGNLNRNKRNVDRGTKKEIRTQAKARERTDWYIQRNVQRLTCIVRGS